MVPRVPTADLFHYFGWISLVLIFIVAACGKSTGGSPLASEGTVHPTPENIPDDEIVDSIQMTDKIQGGGALQNYARKLLNAEEIQILGQREGDRYEMIGRVQDVAAGEKGSIILLDSRFNEVRIYSSQGKFVRAFGGPGRGPNEFAVPWVMQYEQGYITVAGRMGQIKIFKLRDDSVVYRSIIHLAAPPEDLCMMEEYIYVEGLSFKQASKGAEEIIRVFSVKGDRIGAFGQPYKSESAMVRSLLSRGKVACSEDPNVLVSTFNYLPVIYGYSINGKLKWKSKLADFKPMEMVEDIDQQGRPGITYDPTPASTGRQSDVIWTLTAAPKGKVIIQVGRRTTESIKANPRGYAELYTYLIDAETGSGIYVGSSLPPIYEVTQQRIYAGVNHPFPQVKIYQLN